jgi:hypothetical protein
LRNLKTLITGERRLLSSIIRDTEIRAVYQNAIGHNSEAFDVYGVISENDRSDALLESEPKSYPVWNSFSEVMKASLGALMAIEMKGYAFTVTLCPDLENKWVANNKCIPGLIQKRIKHELDVKGIGHLPYFYAIEARTKHGRSRCPVHLHGYIIPDDPILATIFKLVLENAICGGVKIKKTRKRSIKIEPIYNKLVKGERDVSWVAYLIKNIHRYDARLKPRRVFFSQTLTKNTRNFWGLIREEPIV